MEGREQGVDVKTLLQGVEMFEGLSKDELDSVAALCQERSYRADAIIAKQGNPSDELYIIQEGFVEIGIEGAAGAARRAIVHLGSGQTVGEMSFVDQGPRSATVRAISDPTTVIVIAQKDFEALCSEEAHIGYVVIRNIAADLSFRLRQRNLSEV